MTKKAVATIDACCTSLSAAPLDEERAVDLAHAFAALSDPVRLRLLSLIASSPEVCACDLVEPVGKSQPTVSHHLRVLREAGLVVGDRRGTWVWYSAVPERIDALRAVLTSA